MSWPESLRESNAEADGSHTDATALFAGDTGSLPLDARRVLCQLLAGPSVDAERHGLLWPALLREEAAIRACLCDLFLELVLDRDLDVAFVRQADTGELDAPALLRSNPLTFIDSVLLLFLRQRLSEAQAHGQRAVVDGDEVHAQLAVYAPTQGTDSAGFTRKIDAAIEKMKKHNVLRGVRGSDGRYEVAPTLKLLFSAEHVQALDAVYRSLLDGREIDAEAVDEDES